MGSFNYVTTLATAVSFPGYYYKNPVQLSSMATKHCKFGDYNKWEHDSSLNPTYYPCVASLLTAACYEKGTESSSLQRHLFNTSYPLPLKVVVFNIGDLIDLRPFLSADGLQGMEDVNDDVPLLDIDPTLIASTDPSYVVTTSEYEHKKERTRTHGRTSRTRYTRRKMYSLDFFEGNSNYIREFGVAMMCTTGPCLAVYKDDMAMAKRNHLNLTVAVNMQPSAWNPEYLFVDVKYYVANISRYDKPKHILKHYQENVLIQRHSTRQSSLERALTPLHISMKYEGGEFTGKLNIPRLGFPAVTSNTRSTIKRYFLCIELLYMDPGLPQVIRLSRIVSRLFGVYARATRKSDNGLRAYHSLSRRELQDMHYLRVRSSQL